MDRRTLLFVIALTLTLFGVNIYFEQRRQDDLREWQAQNQSKLLIKQKQLQSEIAEHSLPATDFPIVDIYADAEGKQFLTTGIESNKSILTLAWGPNVPSVYSRKHATNEPLAEYKLASQPSGPGDLAVFQQDKQAPMHVGFLPEFGSFYLQVLVPSTNLETPPVITVGQFTDGKFTLLAEQLEKLKIEIGQDKGSEKSVIGSNALVLLQNGKNIEPVGYYQAASHKLILLKDIPGLNIAIDKPAAGAAGATTLPGQKAEEKFYVLETPYQQLVFSNYGGALAEINLPFAKEDPQSVVKEIEFDREMVEKHPYNAHFPSHAYYTPGANDKFEEHSQGKLGGYYPLIRRDLIQPSGQKSIKISPKYYSLNVVSEYPELAELVYEVKKFDDHSIVFEASQPHRRITKTFSLEPKEKLAPYILNVAIKVEGDSRGLWLSSGVPEVEWISGAPAPALKYRITRNNKPDVEEIDLPQDAITVTSVNPDWISNSNGFLGTIMDSIQHAEPGYRVQKVSGTVVPSRLIEIDKENERFKAQDMPGYITSLPLKSTGGSMNFRIFAGPFAESVLKTIDNTYSDPATGYNPDYIAGQSFHGWFSFISEPFAKFLFILMKFFYQITGSWGFSIILLTVALRIMMYPLNAWSSKSMLRMQQIAPEVAEIQERNKKNPKQAQIEIMNLYRDRGVNPVSGCLPMLIQMPFLIGMFDLLKSTFELRGASFIPGWIDNLAAPDVLFSWNTPIFFIGNQFHLLPIILGAVMFLQQKLMSPLPKDPKLLTDQQRQQQAMGTMMSIVFAIMFYNFPSGLNIYWLSSMILGILQQWWTTKTLKPIDTSKKVVKQKASK